ncbi:MAG: glycosyltransferase family 39 protein [Anaerolineae bacterium]|nr:glycosyltransferase family 39 protein [Anaerolineae bacterium]
MTSTPTEITSPSNRLLARFWNGLQTWLVDLEGSHNFITVCLVLSLALRLGWLLVVSPAPVSDFRWYFERGRDMAAGYGYSMRTDDFWPDNVPPPFLSTEPSRQFTAYWPVGYPAFLAGLFFVFGPSTLIAQLANLVLSGFILILAYQIAKRLFQSELSGRLTLLLLAFYPDHIFYTSLIATEILFLFLLLLTVLLLLMAQNKLRWAIAAGVVCGLACLVKPQTILVPGLVLALQFMRVWSWPALKHYAKLGVLSYLMLGLTLVPWTWRNYLLFDDFVFISTNGGYNLLVGNNPQANGTYSHDKPIAAMLSDVFDEQARDAKATALAISYIRENPLQTLKLWPYKVWHLYKRESIGLYWNQQGLSVDTNQRFAPIFTVLMTFAQIYYGMLAILFMGSLFTLKRAYSKIGLYPFLPISLIIYFTSITMLTFGIGRFHFPIIPWVIMVIGAGITTIVGSMPATRTRVLSLPVKED